MSYEDQMLDWYHNGENVKDRFEIIDIPLGSSPFRWQVSESDRRGSPKTALFRTIDEVSDFITDRLDL